MKNILLIILLFGLIYNAHSQQIKNAGLIHVYVVDSFHNPIPSALVYLTNDSIDKKGNIQDLHSYLTYYDGSASVKRCNEKFIQAAVIGYHTNTIELIDNQIDYYITLNRRTYNLPTIVINKEGIDLKGEHPCNDFQKYSVETYEGDTLILQIVCTLSDPLCGGYHEFSKQIGIKLLKNIKFDYMTVHFRVIKNGDIEIIKTTNLKEKYEETFKKIFLGISKWSVAENRGRKVETEYKIRIENNTRHNKKYM